MVQARSNGWWWIWAALALVLNTMVLCHHHRNGQQYAMLGVMSCDDCSTCCQRLAACSNAGVLGHLPGATCVASTQNCGSPRQGTATGPACARAEKLTLLERRGAASWSAWRLQ